MSDERPTPEDSQPARDQTVKDPSARESKAPKKPTPSGVNVFLIAAIIVVTVLAMVMTWPLGQAITLDYNHLASLVKQGKGASVEVVEGVATKRRVRYSNLYELSQTSPIVIGPSAITGRIKRESFPPAPEGASADEANRIAEGTEPVSSSDVNFSTPRLGLPDPVLENLTEKLAEWGFGWTGDQEPTYFAFVMLIILLSIGAVAFAVFMLVRVGGSGNPMAFARSRGKLYAQEDIGLTFKDVAGIDEAVEELQEVVDFLKTPDKFRRLGGRIPKGVLLVGPPGTGKTLLAKAIAGEAHVPFFSLSGSDFVEMYVGVGAARVRDTFRQAEAKAPCIVFIDELDALGKTRGGNLMSGQDEREQTLNALLVEMDGFASNSGVILLGATNRPETLDPALMRPGRFDRHVLVDKPDVRGREHILQVHTANVRLAEDVELRQLAAITSGFVGADLANLVNEAALLAARNGKDAVGMTEFNEGVDRVTAGLEKKQRVMHQDEKRRVAYHESGHALMAYSLPNTDPVHKVSIIPRGLAALGYMMQRPEQDRYLMTKGELLSRIKVLLAGTVTEEIVFEEVSTGAQNDLERASDIARRMVMEFGMSRLGRVNYRERTSGQYLAGSDGGASREHSEQTAREIDQEVRSIIEDSLEACRQTLERRRVALDALAKRLIEKEVIDSVELRDIIEEVSPSDHLPGGDGLPHDHPPPVVSPIPRNEAAAQEQNSPGR